MNDAAPHPREVFAQSPLHGPAYGPMFKGTATVLVIAIVFYAVRAFQNTEAMFTFEMKAGLAMIAFVVLATYSALMRSTTRLDADGISQTLMFKRPVAWDNVRSVRLVRLPTATRLFVRTGGPRTAVFHAGSEDLGIGFALIAKRYPAH